jgi:hypothetical protein
VCLSCPTTSSATLGHAVAPLSQTLERRRIPNGYRVALRAESIRFTISRFLQDSKNKIAASHDGSPSLTR